MSDIENRIFQVAGRSNPHIDIISRVSNLTAHEGQEQNSTWLVLETQILSILVIATVSVVPGLTARAEALGKQTYTIAPGDSLSTIASTHGKGIDWRRLYDANPDIKHPDLILAGSTLAIPTPQDKFAPRAIPAPAPVAVATPAPAPAAAPVQSVTPAPQTSPTGLAGCELARSLINQYD